MGITYNHSNYKSKRYTPQRCLVEALIDPKQAKLQHVALLELTLYPKTMLPLALRNNPAAIMVNCRF